MVESDRCISPIQWDRNSEVNSMDEPEQEQHNDIKEIQRICTQSSPQLDNNYRLPTKIKYLFQESRYFMIKSNNFENVSLSKVRNVWSTTRANEIRLNKAFFETKNVLLIFSVKESGKFQGYARLATASNPKKHITWVLPSHMSQRQLSGVFELDWLSREDVPFSKTNHLVNAWNEHKPVKIGRDGQEIEPSCGEFLCRLFPVDDDCPFNEIIEKAKYGPGQYNDNNGINYRQSTHSMVDNRSQDYYNNNNNSTNKVVSSYDTEHHSYHRQSQYDTPRQHSRSPYSKRRDKEDYSESTRMKDDYQQDSTDVFLNGNYEDYLREQNNFNRVYNHYSYEQRVDDFLRNIVKREAVPSKVEPSPPAPRRRHRDNNSSDYSRSSSSSYKRKRRRSKSNDRRSNRSSKYYSKRYRSGSRHRR